MMTFNLSSLLLTATLYLAFLFALAYIAEQGKVSARLIKHPLTYVLSLGVSISIWSFYAAVASASVNGYGYTAYYTGYAAAFIFAPMFLRPILHITRTYQLSSIADLFAFRFRSPWAGTLSAITLLLCIFPLTAVQVSALSSSLQVLAPQANTHLLVFIFFLIMLIFTITFGARDISGRDKHQGLVIAIAFESLTKIVILCALGLYAIYAVFGGFDELSSWLRTQPPEVTRLEAPMLQSSSNLIILLFFSAAITIPHMFHMIFRENSNPASLNIARWGFPLMLLIISVPVLPILWASTYLNSSLDVEYSALAIGLLTDSPLLTQATFIGGLAAVFGITVVITMTVSSMCLNHLLLPLHKPKADTDLYHWLVLYRRIFISLIMVGCFCSYLVISHNSNITNISFSSFIAGAQLLPGLITLLYWPNGNSKGFVAGLLAGIAAWSLFGLIPMLTDASSATVNWNFVASISLLSNSLALIVVSLLTRTSDEELSAGEMCSMDTSRRPRRIKLLPKTPQEFINLLSEPLGEEAASHEVFQAMKDLNIDHNETRPHLIQLLREQIEANLSGLLGPTMSHQMIDRSLPYEKSNKETTLDVNVIERQMETYPGNLSGVALDLDRLRRHHRQMLQELPIGVCSLNNNSEIAIWNSVMEKLTNISSTSIVGRYPTNIEEPWGSLLLDFINDSKTTHIPKKSVLIDDKQHWLSLHKAQIETTRGNESQHNGLVIVVEDFTETELLESGLAHSERLASIGRLAAGVAHEIGNPITGIACLAQNIRDETDNDELRLMAEQIIQQTNRTSRIVQSLVNFSHNGTTGTSIENEPLNIPNANEAVSIHECANEAIQLISLNQADKDIEYINNCQKSSKIFSDKQRLQQILVNLLTNSRDASTTGKRISVTDSIISNQISITVSDEGEGIPDTIQDRIFEPFFTTKEPGKGTGLGLALVYSITEGLGGSIRIVSPTNKVSKTGTRVIVTFPCYDERSTSA